MHTEEANAQHYEVPDAIFDLALGPKRKYSCCFFENDQMPLA
ncbi:MAG: class I SAM-dependent methyltransferase, partial [Beijerinckiaceae bacterium]